MQNIKNNRYKGQTKKNIAWKEENIRRNWEQNYEIGNPMETKDPAHSCVQFINPNGITFNDNNLDITLLCETMLEYGTDHVELVEINLDTMCQEVRQRICNEIKQQLQTSAVNMASSWIPVQKFYEPGGDMSIAQGDIIGRKILDSSNLLE
eukprot:3997255-Ditylum_brightwellii.AAC.1